jgi:hypothetical protein
MIKEITNQSGGANIKILSDKENERDMKEISISIGGPLNGKIQAASIISERIECFKHEDKAQFPGMIIS